MRIGNSRGVRIPSNLLKGYAFEDEAILELREEGILIRPVRKAHQGWEEEFRRMHKNQDDSLLMDDVFEDEDFDDWK